MSSASAELTADFLNRLRTFVRRRVQSDHDAEDIVQEVLARFIERSASVKSESAYAWMFTVARRAIIDRARAAGVRQAAPLDENDALIADIASDPTAAMELARCMEPMLASLSPEDRTLLQRVDMLGESQAQLASEFGMSNSGMKSRVQRARKRLLKTLENCCAIERDRRGSPAAYAPRVGRSCPCDCGNGVDGRHRA